MPIDAAQPPLPLHESLAQFFAGDARQPVPLSQLAELLGTSTANLRAMLDRDGVRSPAESLPWAEAACHLIDAWPRVQLLAMLGEHAGRIPRQFHPTRVGWSIPVFIVRAMEHQAAAESRRDPRVLTCAAPNHTILRGVHDYVADLLFNEIQPETLIAFGDDSEFLSAYHYPDGERWP